jgi:peroxiredoxin
MKRLWAFLLCAGIGGGLAAPAKTHLKVGDTAPDFTLRSTTGEFTLSEYRGKRSVVLAFISAAFTGG